MDAAAAHYPQASTQIADLKASMLTNGDKVQRAIKALEVRSLINCDHDIEMGWDGKWETQLFNCQCERKKDRLFGIWGVPMYMKGIALPYDDLRVATQLVRKYYPSACFTLYNTCPYESGHVLDWKSTPLTTFTCVRDVEDVLLAILGEPIDIARTTATYHPVPRNFSCYRNAENLVVVITSAVIALGWAPKPCNPIEDTPIYLTMDKHLLERDDCHDCVTKMIQTITTRPDGIHNNWKLAFDVWRFLKSLL